MAQEIRIAVARAAMADGDARGTDSKIVGRPKASTRLFEGPLDARGSVVRIYTTKEDASEVLADLVRAARRNGFAQSGAADEPGTASLQRANSFVVARVTSAEGRGELAPRRTILSVVEFGFDSVGETDRE